MLPRQLGLPVIVSQEQFALVFDGASLAAPIDRADARLLDLLQRYADDLLAERAHRDDLVARANRWIIQNLHTGQVDVLQLVGSCGHRAPGTARRAVARVAEAAPASRPQLSGRPCHSARANHLPARLQRPQRVHPSVSAVDRPYAIEVAGGAVARTVSRPRRH